MDFPWQTFSVATAGWLLVAMFVTLMWKGKIVPKSTMDEVTHDRNEWRTESRIKDAQLAEKDKQLGHLSEVGETQKAVLTALGRLQGQEPT